jgi:hypothetical protein
MTIRDLCLCAMCLEVSLCTAKDGHRSFDAKRIDHFDYTSRDKARHP